MKSSTRLVQALRDALEGVAQLSFEEARRALDAALAQEWDGTALVAGVFDVQSSKFGDRQTRTAGVVAHIKKEADEALANPGDLVEWADIILLAIDGYRRNGGKADELLPLLKAKIDIVAGRTYPDPYETPDDVALEHARPLVWKCKKRGFSHIYTAEGISRAVVDRRGFGLRGCVTFNGLKFDNVHDAKRYAEAHRDAPEEN